MADSAAKKQAAIKQTPVKQIANAKAAVSDKHREVAAAKTVPVAKPTAPSTKLATPATKPAAPSTKPVTLDKPAVATKNGSGGKAPGPTGATASKNPVATKASAATSRPQSRAGGSHDGKEDTYDPPVLPKYLPWNPRSDEMKKLKTQQEKQEKGGPGGQQALPVRKASDKTLK